MGDRTDRKRPSRSSVPLGAAMLMAVTVLCLRRSTDAGRLGEAQTGPKGVAKTYVEFIQQGRFHNAYELLVPAERKAATLEEYVGAWGASAARLKGTITECSASAEGRAGATVQIHVQPPAGGKPVVVELHLSKCRDGQWAIAHGEQLAGLVSRFRAEQVEGTVARWAEAWRNRDYAGMVQAFGREYLRNRYGEPPYVAEVRDNCLEWESEHADLLGMSCTWQYVREQHGVATIPIKLCYARSDSGPRFVPYLITLRREPTGGHWTIIGLDRTSAYARPPEFLELVPAERLRAEEQATGD